MARRFVPRGAQRAQDGQAAILLVGVLSAVLLGALVLGSVAQGIGIDGEQQRAADLAALAGARAMRESYDRLFEPRMIGGQPNPRHLERSAYLALGQRAALDTARRNGASQVAVEFPDSKDPAPVRIRVAVDDPIKVISIRLPGSAHATAMLTPSAAALAPMLTGNPGEYPGPFAMRQGKPMRPDVALAFDRMQAAAQADGVALIITSAFRSDAEQAVLFAKHPDPKWVGRPGTSLHRLGTELDLGPTSASSWLARNAARFGFLQRYSWEPWHYGYTLNAGSSSVGWPVGRHLNQPAGIRAHGGPAEQARDGGTRADSGQVGGDGTTGSTLPSFVPPQYAPAIARAAMRWNISGALLAAQLWQESKFNPNARSSAGAQGIAQFMPDTAKTYGLSNPFNPNEAIDAQGHLMHDLLRRFGSVPLALAAYNAGEGRVSACGCVPPIPETVSYVAAILGLLNGAGDSFGGVGELEVRLVQ